jgi:hypothetical protein
LEEIEEGMEEEVSPQQFLIDKCAHGILCNANKSHSFLALTTAQKTTNDHDNPNRKKKDAAVVECLITYAPPRTMKTKLNNLTMIILKQKKESTSKHSTSPYVNGLPKIAPAERSNANSASFCPPFERERSRKTTRKTRRKLVGGGD